MATPLKLQGSTRREPLKCRLTAAYCRSVSAPKAGRLVIYDTVQPGLALQVTPTGSRSYYLIRKVHGRARRIRLAGGATAVDTARKLARKAIADIDAGRDPMADRRRQRQQATTLADVWEIYQRERERTDRTIRADAGNWKNVARLANRALGSIQPEEIANLHARIGERGKSTANRTVELVLRIYRFALRRRLYSGANPAEGIDKYPEHERERFVRPHELPKLLEAIDAAPDPWCDYFRLVLLTGARKSAVASMAWQDIDLQAGTWALPRTTAGAKGQSTTIPLVAEAVKILRKRKKASGGSAWVFPSPKTPKRHVSDPLPPWWSIREAAELPDVTIHDLRRTCGSYLAAAGVSLVTIGKALGHRSLASTAIYSRLDVSDVRKELQHVADAMTAAGGGK